ncbi:MAG TPA: hypothetical protein VFW98_04895 [Gemmatimonadaceae bacterium]|nr:hypothetical protein [Gemmatimonadaceae bacterium]
MTDPFARWRGTTLWRALDDALGRAEADGVLQFAACGGREATIGHVCMQLDAEGLATGTRLAAVRVVLQRMGWREEDYRDSLALELCALLDRSAERETVAEYVGRFETEFATRPSSTLSDRLALAAAVRQAYEQADESDAPPG